MANATELRTWHELASNAVAMASRAVKERDDRPLSAQSKGDRDYVTAVDFEAEQCVRSYLAEVTPDILFLGEESGGRDPHEGLCWVLDPVDGTINFMRGNPLCAVSLALLENGIAQVGVIDFPFLGERFSACRGMGAQLNGSKIVTSKVSDISEAVVCMGDFAVGEKSGERVALAQRILSNLAGHALRVRMLGTAAADLAWLAAGRLDVSITLSNNSWDVQAGILLVREAGGEVFDFGGADHSLDARCTIASNVALRPYILDTLEYSTQVN